MKETNNIRKGRIIEVTSLILGIGMGVVADYVRGMNQSIVGKTEIPDYVLLLGLIALTIILVGRTIAREMCKCPACGHSVMNRYGNIYEHCPHCGKEIKY